MKNVGWPTNLECHGKEIRTSGFRYVGSAENKHLAVLFSKSPSLYQICERAAKGEKVSQDEFKALVDAIQQEF
jgi:hypothetical protein